MTGAHQPIVVSEGFKEFWRPSQGAIFFIAVDRAVSSGGFNPRNDLYRSKS